MLAFHLSTLKLFLCIAVNTVQQIKLGYTFISFYSSGSKEERLAVESAIQHGTKPETYQPDSPFKKKDVEFKIETMDKVYVGSDFEVDIALTNKGSEERNVSLFVNLQMCYYTGTFHFHMFTCSNR